MTCRSDITIAEVDIKYTAMSTDPSLSIFLSPDPLTPATSALRPHSQLTQTGSPYLLKIYEMTSLCQCVFADLLHTHFLPLFPLSLTRSLSRRYYRVLLSSQWLLRCINMAESCILCERETTVGRRRDRRIRGLMNIFT